jgi:predicted dehydrogenase
MRAIALVFAGLASATAADIRVGYVGTDTSHVTAFIKVLNDASHPDHIPGARVVAAYKGGSPDVESSRTRVEGFARELQEKWKVELVPDIATLCSRVDAVMLESVDGRKHLEQAREIIKAGKPMFIDKPLASTLEDAREIARLAKAAGVPWFSTSSLRYGDIAQTMKFSDATGAITWGPGPWEEHHYLDLSWYAIHPVEMLFALMGTGVAEVSRVTTPGADVVTGRWKDGRIGVVRAIRPSSGYGAVVFRPKEVVQSSPKAGANYVPMLKEIIRFFETKVPPVPNEETLEIFAFMDAAQRSREAGGRPMALR